MDGGKNETRQRAAQQGVGPDAGLDAEDDRDPQRTVGRAQHAQDQHPQVGAEQQLPARDRQREQVLDPPGRQQARGEVTAGDREEERAAEEAEAGDRHVDRAQRQLQAYSLDATA